ncbi:MAG: tRNA 4-thiouridine(8) synthase ThiI [Candidatus Muiribacteriota bacterium]
MNKNYHALVLFSGGLDSYITAHLLKTLNYQVTLITYKSYFFKANIKTGTHKIQVGEYELKNHVFDISSEFLEVLKKPKFGFGKNLNPCIDCKIFMLKKTKKLLDKFDADFIATGEVLDQRPKSQKKFGLNAIIRDAGVKDVLIRPLSISHLDLSEIEKRAIVNRDEITKIIQIHGRSRKKQLEYAKNNNIKDFSTPSGGCLLTYEEYCRKLKKLLSAGINDPLDMKLLKVGRHYNISKNNYKKLIVGKNQRENIILEEIKGVIQLYIKDFIVPGPISLILSKDDLTTEELENSSQLHIYHSDYKKNKTEVSLTFVFNGKKTDHTILFDKDKAEELKAKKRI